ncbi:hypothetical protein OG909_16550 [Streptomyces sp. NBC_01754]|nr:hypothetical protein [Streptomyces sp. NBC_01754]WSC93756.1 hypothetical protein OG909_16550 [Streptomyces sp. NBC_01754]
MDTVQPPMYGVHRPLYGGWVQQHAPNSEKPPARRWNAMWAGGSQSSA